MASKQTRSPWLLFEETQDLIWPLQYRRVFMSAENFRLFPLVSVSKRFRLLNKSNHLTVSWQQHYLFKTPEAFRPVFNTSLRYHNDTNPKCIKLLTKKILTTQSLITMPIVWKRTTRNRSMINTNCWGIRFSAFIYNVFHPSGLTNEMDSMTIQQHRFSTVRLLLHDRKFQFNLDFFKKREDGCSHSRL